MQNGKEKKGKNKKKENKKNTIRHNSSGIIRMISITTMLAFFIQCIIFDVSSVMNTERNYNNKIE